MQNNGIYKKQIQKSASIRNDGQQLEQIIVGKHQWSMTEE